jgi:hypothetical protein
MLCVQPGSSVNSATASGGSIYRRAAQPAAAPKLMVERHRGPDHNRWRVGEAHLRMAIT